jgi:four helix bundle protein
MDDKTPNDLEERTACFGETVVRFASSIRPSAVNSPLISQLVRAGTSVGANYVEADEADTRKDFIYKIGLCKRESRETGHWLRMLLAAEPGLAENVDSLADEAGQLVRIFAAIQRSAREKDS